MPEFGKTQCIGHAGARCGNTARLGSSRCGACQSHANEDNRKRNRLDELRHQVSMCSGPEGEALELIVGILEEAQS